MDFPEKDMAEKDFSAVCPTNPFKQLIMMMDPSHCFKKIRNNVISSGNHKGCIRLLTLPSGLEIHWQMWQDAYQWDRQNPVQIHKALTNEHLYPNSASKMRNKLAEDALNEEMLNLMYAYKKSLGLKRQVLDGAIELLQNTSKIIGTFRDRRGITTTEDVRLTTNRQVQLWFQKWEEDTIKEGN